MIEWLSSAVTWLACRTYPTLAQDLAPSWRGPYQIDDSTELVEQYELVRSSTVPGTRSIETKENPASNLNLRFGSKKVPIRHYRILSHACTPLLAPYAIIRALQTISARLHSSPRSLRVPFTHCIQPCCTRALIAPRSDYHSRTTHCNPPVYQAHGLTLVLVFAAGLSALLVVSAV